MMYQETGPRNISPMSRRTLIKAAAAAATAIVGAAMMPSAGLAAAPDNLAGTLGSPAAAPQAAVSTFQTRAQDAPPGQGTPP
ncbi:MAG: hypothetical protein M3176_18040, partial [Chloroflexota bacterium]|nr:hypothetical protein [Chloroflexota bacterium]